jgi:MoaA/NifB/PqqE/SkfB family radical SAM enzyme
MDKIKKARFYMNSFRSYLKYKINSKFNEIFKLLNLNLTPFLVIILPTNRCNLNCIYCPKTIEKGKKDIPFKKLKKIFDLCKKRRVPFVSFSGGEPMLHPEFEKWSNYARKIGLVMNLNTNGTLLTKKKAKIVANNFDFVRISLDGDKVIQDKITRCKGTYEQILKGIKNLSEIKNRKVKISINIVVNNRNINSIENTVKFISPLVDSVALLPEFNIVQHNYKKLINETNFSKKLNIIQKNLKKINKSGNTNAFIHTSNLKKVKEQCLAGKLFYTFSWDGKVYSCPFAIEKNPLYDYYLKKITLKLPFDSPNKRCHGCHATCSIEISRVYSMTVVELFKEYFSLKGTFNL